MFAHCYRSGEIIFSRKGDLDGMICVGEAPAKILRPLVNVLARHGYESGTYLVPGIPEANSNAEAETALVLFMDRMKERLEGPALLGAEGEG